MINPAKRAVGYGLQTVWSTFTPLAQACGAVNLGQGFPDIPPADFVKQAAVDSILSTSDMNQYAPSRGRKSLRDQLAIDYSKDLGKVIDGDHNVMVTLGANQGIFTCLQTFVDEGQSVLLIEPYFDIYKPSVSIVGGQVCTVQLTFDADSGWKLDFEQMEQQIKNHQVKAIILNTPHNPTGKVFTKQELEAIAKLAQQYNLLVISDEVYDELYFTSQRPTRIASIPGMWERTITVGSAGKRFGVTGWRIGWLIGHEGLLNPILSVHSRTVYSAPSPFQEACAMSLKIARESGYFEQYRSEFKQKRDYLHSVLTDNGMQCCLPDGSYFMMAKTDQLTKNLNIASRPWDEFPGMTEPQDYAIARWLTETIGVTAIPPSAFYEHDNFKAAAHWLRFCFCKRQDTLEAAKLRLESQLSRII